MKFIASRELGRLAKWLRILGFDAAYFREDNKSSFKIMALRDDRVILTRNKLILKDRALQSVFIKSEVLGEQIKQVLDDFKINVDDCRMFTRCIVCNAELINVDKTTVVSKVPKYIYETQENFCQCPICSRVYWQGTHWGNVQEILEKASQ
jgi:uncharacterized protein with PIN domain